VDADKVFFSSLKFKRKVFAQGKMDFFVQPDRIFVSAGEYFLFLASLPGEDGLDNFVLPDWAFDSAYGLSLPGFIARKDSFDQSPWLYEYMVRW